MKKKQVMFLLLLLSSISVIAQTTLTGKVTDASNVPLPGVNVIIKGTTQGTTTDFDGNYSVLTSTGDILEFSYLGFVSQSISVGDQTQINVILNEDVAKLDEVVVVGYGTQKKISVTGSVATLKVENIVEQPASNVKNLLVGQVPGLVTNQNPGLPGADNVDLSVRGFGNPLVIVDGVESTLDRLDPNDIENISVLKDASAAIYGARAGNGVILVTTKRGTKGKMTVNYHGWTGTQAPVAYNKKSNAVNYILRGREALFNEQYDPNNPNATIDYGTGNFTDENLQKFIDSGESYDWVDATLRSSGASIAQHNFNFNGGSDKVRYYTSLGTLSQTGIFRGDYDYKKLNVTNNLDVELTNNLSLKFNSSYIYEEQDYAFTPINRIWNDLDTAQPVFRTSLPNPDLAPYSGFSERSPVARTFKKWAGYNYTEKNTLAAAIDLNYKTPFIEGLSLGLRVNFRHRAFYNETFEKPYTVWSYDPDDNDIERVDGYKNEGELLPNNFSKRYFSGTTNGRPDARFRLLYRGTANYSKNFNKHAFGVLTFLEKEDNTYRTIFSTTRDNLSLQNPDIDATDDALTTVGGTGIDTEYTRISAAGRINYAYDNKYLLEATLRADASSKFGSNNRWGFFPSVSMGWNIAKENFLLDNNTINQLKLRLSYSQTGIDSNVGNTQFDYLTGFTIQDGSYILNGNAVPLIGTAGVVNEDITWETTTLYNIGLDVTLFSGKVNASIDGFYRARKDILAEAIESFPTTFGANLPDSNINSDNTRGLDVALGYKGHIGEEFKFSLNGVFGIHKKRWDHFEEDIDENDPIQVKYDQRSGRNKNITWGYQTAGLFNTQEAVDEYIAAYDLSNFDGGDLPRPGDFIYVDTNNDGVLDTSDRVNIGYGTSAEVTYSLNTNFEYKGVSLNMLWQGASNVKVTAGGILRAPFGNEQSSLELHDKYSWRQDPANPGVNINPNAILPAFETGSRQWNSQLNDFWVLDGTYVRLKAATLSYSLDSSLLDKIGFNRFELYVSGDNLFTLSKLGIFKDGIDPEQANNPSANSLPVLRTYTLGLRLSI
ncbi:TonB-dependent receptor [Seonamhaeicola sp.]|uniref:SusC/RagA family TonB-linked outer membrane protein n=1 Tax=Seonamhaeicola sp. TaxID=1912245 RepID=UPI0026223C97|nr:TonB-dependent receptor [Seonamhaeicola sp.]